MTGKAAVLTLLAAVCALPLPGAEKKIEPAPSLTSFGAAVEVNVVNVEVYVTDRDGRRVTDLKRGEATISEDGKPMELTHFAAVSTGRGVEAPNRADGAARAPIDAESTAAAVAASGPDPETALSLVVFVDDLHLHPENRTKAVNQIRAFLAHSVRPGDRVMVAAYGLGLSLLQPFTADGSAIDTALKQAEAATARGLDDEARRSAFRTMYALHKVSPCAVENVRPIEAYASETRDEALRTANALTVIINSLSGVPGHRALLFVSDGISVTPGEELFQTMAELCGGSMEPTELSTGNTDKVPRNGDDGAKYNPQQAALDSQRYSVAKRFEDLAAHANANRVTLYTLQASGLQGFGASGADLDPDERRLLSSTVQMMQTGNLRGSLTAMAVDTGGRAMLDANDLAPELARMQEDFESYYSLGYTPAHHGDRLQHKIEVKVKRPGLTIRYRPSYRDKPTLEKTVDRTLTALLHGIEDNPLEVAVDLGAQTLDTATGNWTVPIQLKIPLYKLAIVEEGGAFRGRLRLLIAIRDGKGGTSPVRQVEVPIEISRKEVLSALGQHYLYTLTLKMPAGEQRVAVAVRDDLGAATSYLSRTLSVGPVQAAAAGN